jgi:hypothetical protein
MIGSQSRTERQAMAGAARIEKTDAPVHHRPDELHRADRGREQDGEEVQRDRSGEQQEQHRRAQE